MAEEIERGHQHHRVDGEPPVRFKHRERAAAFDRRLFAPARRFRHRAADIEHQQRRYHADHEHAAPADIGKQHAIDDRGHEIAGRIAGLQQAGDEATGMRRNGFHRQRGADAPFAAHRDAVQRAQHDQHSQVRRKAGGELQHRIQQDVDHQRRPPAEAVGGAAENEGADRAHRQRQQDRVRDRGNVGMKFGGDVLQHEHQQKEVECIQRPSEKACRDHMLLFAGPA